MAVCFAGSTGYRIAMRQADGTIRKRRYSINDPGHAHELTFSCYKGLPLLGRDRTRQWFIEALDRARTKHSLEMWAFVIMPEHVHLLLLPQPAEYRMAAILQAIKQPVACRAIDYLRTHHAAWLEKLRVNRRSARAIYHFWQPGGGCDRNLTNAAIAWQSVEYMHNNPVRRGLAKHPTDWAWSSARWYDGHDDVVLPMDATPPNP